MNIERSFSFEEWKEMLLGPNHIAIIHEDGTCDGTCDTCLYSVYKRYLEEHDLCMTMDQAIEKLRIIERSVEVIQGEIKDVLDYFNESKNGA